MVSIIALDDIEAANAYDAMAHTPNDLFTVVSYGALHAETMQQWQGIIANVDVQFHTGDHDYADSNAMFADLFGRQHLWTRLSDDDGLPADHPMALKTSVHVGSRQLCLNDIFRAVHDVNGHGRTYSRGTCASFGPVGERNAWLTHRDMYSALARPALWCETRGQAAWTNAFDGHAELPLKDRPFAVQKAGNPPREFL